MSEFNEQAAAVAVTGAAEAIETAEESATVAAVSAGIATESAITSVEAAEAAGVATAVAATAAETAEDAHAAAEAAVAATGEVAYATKTALEEMRSEFNAFKESLKQKPSPEEEETGQLDETPEEIPVANDFRTTEETGGGETASEPKRRRHRFGR